jgi:serine/threonine protein kinase
MHFVDEMAHGDIKGDNIMFTDDFRLVLIDFGFSEQVTTVLKTFTGTPAYNGPEIDTKNWYSIAQADLHTLGVTIFTILFQCFPFSEELYPYKLFRKHYNKMPEIIKNEFFETHYNRVPQREHHAPEILDLVF